MKHHTTVLFTRYGRGVPSASIVCRVLDTIDSEDENGMATNKKTNKQTRKMQ